ncbi:MAG: hypothetical protein IJW49_08035 [Clostridia bacterium]|nr:hypothetical protein [Clostridia bacterium]
MKKILALVLTLAMVLSMFTMGFTVSAANTTEPADAPEGAIAISDVDGLKKMEPGKYYYLTDNITLGSPQVRDNEEDANGLVPLSTSEKTYYTIDPANPGIEEELITIPAGATLDGNGNTIYYGYYISNPGMYTKTNKYANSLNWTHSMFQFAAATTENPTTTIKNLKIGDTTTPVYLGAYNTVGASGNITSNDTWGIFDDTTGSNVVWNNVNFYVERYGRGLGNYNVGPVMTKSLGTHNFTECSVNTPTMSAGSQYGGWIYSSNGPVTMTNCSTNSYVISAGTNESGENVNLEPWLSGSVGAGFIHTAYADVTMIGCKNNIDITANYGGTHYKFGGLVGEIAKGSIYVENCENNGNFWLDKITIGGGLVGRGQNGKNDKFQIINSTNNGDIKRTNTAGTTENHGYGGIAGHVSATTTFEIIGCTNNGNMTGATGNAGGILGLVEGDAPQKILRNNVNNGNLTTIANIVEAAGIVAQFRTSGEISGCKNYGNIESVSSRTAGIMGCAYTSGATVEINGCANYGNVTITATGTQAGGLLAYNVANTTVDACMNFGTITGSSASTHVAGLVANSNVGMTITNSQNHGTVTGSYAKGYYAGILASNTAGVTLNLTNCKNFGAIGNTSVQRAGGIVGYANGGSYNLTKCENYGTLTTNQYSGGMIAEMAGACTVKIEKSYNHGEIIGVHAIAGFVGQVVNNANASVTINNSFNLGDVHHGSTAGEGIGGFLGRIAGTSTPITLTNCINLGTVTGSTKNTTAGAFGDTFGQFIGCFTVSAGTVAGSEAVMGNKTVGGFFDWANIANKPVLTNCHGYGDAVFASGAMSLKGWIRWDENGTALSTNVKSTIPVTEAPNGGVAGINVEYTGDVKTLLNTSLEDAMANIKSATGVTMMQGDTAKGEDEMVIATPELRGYQMSNDGGSIRFAATISSINYSEVGFKYTVEYNGKVVAEETAIRNYVWETLNATGNNNSIEEKTASEMGGKYFTALVFTGVPATGTLKLTVTPIADTYTGTGYTATIVDGAVTSVVAAN